MSAGQANAGKTVSQKKQTAKWVIYIHNRPFDSPQIQSKGRLFVEKKALLKALNLIEGKSFLKEDEIAVKGETYLWLPAAAKLVQATLLVNKDTRIIDIIQIRAAAPKNLGSPTIVTGGSSGSPPSSSSSSPSLPMRGGY